MATTARRPPRLVALGVLEAIAVLRQEEFDLRTHVLDFHEPLFRGLREELRRRFLGHFVIQTDRGDPQQKVQVWNPLTPDRQEFLTEIQDTIGDVFDTLADEDEDLLREELDAAMLDGELRELWFLTLGGIEDAGSYMDRLPDMDARLGLLLAAGVIGASWLERLHRWRDDARVRTTRWAVATIVSGGTLDDTLRGVDAAAKAYTDHITGLLTNERHRAFGLGQELALQLVAEEHQIEEIWVARTKGNGELDDRVCPVCAALHMTVTDLQPLADSHPGCRCTKVPVPLRYRENPVRYVDFVASLGEDDAVPDS